MKDFGATAKLGIHFSIDEFSGFNLPLRGIHFLEGGNMKIKVELNWEPFDPDSDVLPLELKAQLVVVLLM